MQGLVAGHYDKGLDAKAKISYERGGKVKMKQEDDFALFFNISTE